MEQQVDLSLFFEYPDEDDEADDAKDEHYELYEADVDEEYQSDEAVYEVPIQQKFNEVPRRSDQAIFSLAPGSVF